MAEDDELGRAKATASALRNIILEVQKRLPEEHRAGFIQAIEHATDRDLRGDRASRFALRKGEIEAGHEMQVMVFRDLHRESDHETPKPSRD